MVLIEPLDFEEIFVTNFAGSTEIFIFIFIVFIAGLAARFRMPNGIAIPLFALFVVFMVGTTSLSGALTGIYTITLMLVSFFVYWGISRYFK